jgi:REP element-mobilizing transposase RayT
MKQTNIFEYFEQSKVRKRYGRTQHGGLAAKGCRKLERPLSTKKWIHLVLKSDKAKGRLSFLTARNQALIRTILREKSKKFGIKIADGANVGNHIHLKLKIQDRESFQRFLKAITCLIARQITGARRGKKFGRFWQGLAFTRVLTSAMEELHLRGYIKANRIEARRGEKARSEFLKKFNLWVRGEREKDRKWLGGQSYDGPSSKHPSGPTRTLS